MSKRTHRPTPTLARLPLLAPLVLAAAPALAQETAATLPPVTVTADQAPRLETPAAIGSNLGLTPRETPASVDVIDRAQLEERGDTTLMDAITRATGISNIGHPGNSGSALSARGFTDSTSVMRLYDGTRQYGNVSASFPFDTWSVERIEVLRGPASVIHGDGAIGGVVNIVPKKPTRGAIQNEMQASVDTDNKRALAFGSGGGVSDTLSYRFDVSGDRSDGWVERGDSRNLSASGALQWDVSPELQLTLSHAQGKQNPMRYAGLPEINGRHPEELRDKNYNVRDGKIEYRDQWTELAARWTPDSSTVLRSKLYRIQSDRHWRNVESFAYDAVNDEIDRSAYSEIGHDQTQVGNVTDAAFTGQLFGRRNRVSIGFDVNHSTFKRSGNGNAGTSSSVDPYHPDPGYYDSDTPYVAQFRTQADQAAVFAEDRIELTKQLSLVGGLRRDQVTLQRHDLINDSKEFERTYRSTGVRLGTVYLLTPDTSLYAQYARAAAPERSLMFMTKANSAFGLTEGRQYEVGVKQSVLKGKGDWSLSVYEIVKTDLRTRDSADPSVWIQVGQQSTQGIEGTVSLPVTNTVRLDANAALLKARFDDFTEAVSGVNVSRDGNVPVDVPERQANLWLGWKALPDWTLSSDLRYVGERYDNTANTSKRPSYTTTDLAAIWQVDPATTLALRGFNVFDRYYFTSVYYYNNQYLVGEGRRFEVTLNHKF